MMELEWEGREGGKEERGWSGRDGKSEEEIAVIVCVRDEKTSKTVLALVLVSGNDLSRPKRLKRKWEE